MLSPNPPPPPPPPPAGALAPPAPPMSVGFEEYTRQLAADVAAREARELELLEEIDGCVGARTRACGLSLNEVRIKPLEPTPTLHRPSQVRVPPSVQAPNPWLSVDGTPCRGYATRQTRELDYCGYWCVRLPRPAPRNPLTHALTVASQGLGRQPQRRARRAQAGAPPRRPALPLRGRDHDPLLLAKRLAHAALGHLRAALPRARGPALLVLNLTLEHTLNAIRPAHACLPVAARTSSSAAV